MQNTDEPSRQETLPAIWRLGFRPFFLAGSLLAALAVPVWLISLYFPQHAWLKVLPLWWHPHELLFGFAMAVVAGFLLTAVQTWTGQPGMKGAALALTAACWLVARLLLLLPYALPVWLPALFDTLFLLLTAGKLWQSIYGRRQWRNIAFPLLIMLAAGGNLLSYQALASGDLMLASKIWDAMIWWLVLMITFVGGRVIPFFTSMRLTLNKPEPIFWLDWAVFIITGMLALQVLFRWLPPGILQVLFLAGALLQLARIWRWFPLRTLREPMLWSLHLSYLCIPLAMLCFAWGYDNSFAARQLNHLLAVGTIGGMCLAMMARVSLGHTGRNIYAGPLIAPAFILMFLAAVIRALFPLQWPTHILLWHSLSGAAWCFSFCWFVWFYARILTTPRIDGRPG